MEYKEGYRESDVANNMNKVDGSIVRWTYNGFTITPLVKCKQNLPTQRKDL